MNSDSPMSKQAFIAHLVQKNGFKRLTPTLLQYQDTTDIVTVAIRDGVVIIIGDGPNVVPNWNMIQVREGPDTFFWDVVLQNVLAKF